MARKPAHQQGDTRQAIAQAAFRLFGRYGYDGVSMAMVAEAVKITKASLYWHYKSKDELYIEAVGQLHALFRHYVFDALRAANEPSAQFAALFGGVGELLADQRVQEGIAGYWLAPSTSELPEVQQVQSRFRSDNTALLADAVRAGIEAGVFTREINADEMAPAMLAIVEVIVLPLREQGAEASRRVIDTLASTFYRAYALREAPPSEA